MKVTLDIEKFLEIDSEEINVAKRKCSEDVRFQASFRTGVIWALIHLREKSQELEKDFLSLGYNKDNRNVRFREIS